MGHLNLLFQMNSPFLTFAHFCIWSSGCYQFIRGFSVLAVYHVTLIYSVNGFPQSLVHLLFTCVSYVLPKVELSLLDLYFVYYFTEKKRRQQSERKEWSTKARLLSLERKTILLSPLLKASLTTHLHYWSVSCWGDCSCLLGVHASVGHERQASEASAGEGCAGCGAETSGSHGWNPRPLVEMVSYHQSHPLSSSAPGESKETKDPQDPRCSSQEQYKDHHL